LLAKGVSPAKICVVPLAYDAQSSPAAGVVRDYPDRFTPDRPLRVLFLGSLILRKGIAETLDAVRLLGGAPAEFWFVGPAGVTPPERDRNDPRLRWIGPVPRGAVHRYYRDADVFLFPTLSDGFGLTQLEAQAWGLPIVASPHCGTVVRHQVDGLLLEVVTGEAIADAIRRCLGDPAALHDMSASARSGAVRFQPGRVLDHFLECAAGIDGEAAPV
jgi:glycosyltransferase involved in cell wall biosynthesis